MIRCQKCGSTLPPNARFCSICGAESAPPAAPPTPAQTNPTAAFGAAPSTASFGAQGYAVPDPEAENRKRTAIAFGGGAALVVVAGLIFAAASGVFSAKKPEASGAAVLSAPPAQTVQAPVLTAPAPEVSTAPVISAPPAQGNPMPEDIIAYLRWLKQFEAGRIALESKSEAQMMLVMQELIKVGMSGTSGMGLLDGDSEEASKNPAPASMIDTKAVNAVIADWNTATGIFQAKTPPNPCATLASNYNGGMSGSVTAMTQILGAGVKAIDSINGAGGQKTGDASEVLTFLTDQKNNASISKNIEASFASANQSLDALRSQYTDIPADIDKAQFSIKTGNAGGINIPIPGMGM
ncbi:MAG: zinc-ribbon domain-containing protein [Armatimonadetes bacterium]|nr:zinc-ribbon domain-containing protein [Armatimonadota bacterium]